MTNLEREIASRIKDPIAKNVSNGGGNVFEEFVSFVMLVVIPCLAGCAGAVERPLQDPPVAKARVVSNGDGSFMEFVVGLILLASLLVTPICTVAMLVWLIHIF